MVPYEWFRRWEDKAWMKRGEEYMELKEKLTERLLEPLYEHCPQVQGKVDHAELSTPLSTRHFTGYLEGEIYGLTATPERFAERRLKPRTPVPGLYLTGSDASTAGVAGALYGGLFAASAVLRRDLRGEVVKGAETARSAA